MITMNNKNRNSCCHRWSLSLLRLLVTTAAGVLVSRGLDPRCVCSAFATRSSGSSGSSGSRRSSRRSSSSTTNNDSSYSSYSNDSSNKGIPDPPPPVLHAKNKKVMPHRDINAPIPITILSGFLGCGKTTLLRSLLSNSDGLRIAAIVNDVAAINIDSKLLRRQTPATAVAGNGTSTATATVAATGTAAAAATLELQNGCACCSKSEELLLSIAEMVTLNDMRDDKDQFDHIVIECSGIANPANIRSMFHDAMLYNNMPLMERIVLDTMVTVVDCSTLVTYLQSPATANPIEAPELFDTGTASATSSSTTTSAADDVISVLSGDAMTMEMDGSNEGVAELIVSQIEISDVILMNKIDLLRSSIISSSNTGSSSGDQDDNNQDELNQITDLLYRLNPRANHIPTVYANVPIAAVLGVAKGQGIALAGILDDHKDAVQFATSTSSLSSSVSSSDTATTEDGSSCSDPKCTDPTHTHDHKSHDHHHHSHDHSDESSLATIGSHDDESGATGTPACNNPTCTDPSHSHDHDHSVADPTASKTTNEHAGIGSFVYRARRPFHPLRLHTFLHHLPIKRGLQPPNDDDDDDNNNHNQPSKLTIPTSTLGIMRHIIRSKGFVWFANSNVAALYISQAGTNLDVSCLGSWWATLPRTEWPREAVDTVLEDFDSRDHVEDNIDENNISLSVGDRRQELVFIGTMLGNPSVNIGIANALDQCLLNDIEYQLYCKSKNDEAALSNLFPSKMPVKQMSY